MSKLEDQLEQQILAAGIEPPTREHRFHPVRRWRLDFCWIDLKLAIEVQGGEWIQGRHSRGSGMLRDCEKFNAAVLLGWKVLFFGGTHVRNGYALDTIQTIMKSLVDENNQFKLI